MASRRLLVSGLGHGGEADVRQRADQLIERLDRFGLRALPDSLYVSAAGFVFVSVTADEGLDDKVGLVRKTLNGTTWKGSKLRIGDADPDWRARLEAERAAAALPRKKRSKARGQAVESPSVHEPVTPDHLEWGWKKTAGGHLVRPLVMRPDKPIPPPVKPDPRKEGKKPAAPASKLRTNRTRARLLTIDPTRYAREHLAGSLLDADTPSQPPDAVWVCETASDSEELPETVCWKLCDPEGNVLQEEQVPTSRHWRALNGAAPQVSREELQHSAFTAPQTGMNNPEPMQDIVPAEADEEEEDDSSTSEDTSEDESDAASLGGTWQRPTYDPAEEDAFSDGYNEQEHVDQTVDGDVSRTVLARLFGKDALKAQPAQLPSDQDEMAKPDDAGLFDKLVASSSGAWWSTKAKADEGTGKGATDNSDDALFDKPVTTSSGAWWAPGPSASAQGAKAGTSAPPQDDASSSSIASSSASSSSSSSSSTGSSSDSDSDSDESSESSLAESPKPPPASIVEPASQPKAPAPVPTTAMPSVREAPAPVAAPSRRAMLLGLASARASAASPTVTTTQANVTPVSAPVSAPAPAATPTPTADPTPVPAPPTQRTKSPSPSPQPEEAPEALPASESPEPRAPSPAGESAPIPSQPAEQKASPPAGEREFQTHYELGQLKNMFEPHVATVKEVEAGGGGFSFAALAEEMDMDEEMDWGAAPPEPEPEPESARVAAPPVVVRQGQPRRTAGANFPLTASSIPSILTRLEHHRIEGHTYFVPFALQHQPCAPDEAEKVIDEAKGSYSSSRMAWKRRRWEISSARKRART